MSCGRRKSTAVKTSVHVNAQSRRLRGWRRLAVSADADHRTTRRSADRQAVVTARDGSGTLKVEALHHRQTSRPRRSAASPATAEKFIITNVNAIAAEALARWNSAPASARP